MNHQTRRTSSLFLVPLVMLAASTPAFGQAENETYQIVASESDVVDFSFSLAVEYGIVAAGAPLSGDFGSGIFGSAFLLDLKTGEQLVRFLPTDTATNDQFGLAIAMSDGIVVVGSLGSAFGSQSGKAYLFDADPASPTYGEQLAALLPDDGAAGDKFGFSLAISNGVAVVGAPFDNDNGGDSGSIYFFDADPNSPNFGSQIMKRVASDAAAFDEFGAAVAMDNGLLVVGAWHNTSFGGAAYIYDVDPQSPRFGDELLVLSATGLPSSSEFGRAVSIDGQMIAVGARMNGTGSVRIFDADPLSPSFGTQTAVLNSNVAGLVGRFGHSVAIKNGQVAIGTPLANINGFASGTAFLFDAISGEQLAHYLPSDGRTFDQFGATAAIDTDGAVVIGAMGRILPNQNRGAVYVFDGPPFVCAADLTGDGQLNFFDVSVFLTFFGLNNPIADFNADGEFNFFDVSAFLTAFAAGCP